MRRCRIQYLHLPYSAKLTFTVLVPGPEEVSAFQGRAAGEKYLLTCDPLDPPDFVFLYSVDVGDVYDDS